MVPSRGDSSVFFTLPGSLILLAAVLLVVVLLPSIRSKRDEVFQE